MSRRVVNGWIIEACQMSARRISGGSSGDSAPSVAMDGAATTVMEGNCPERQLLQ